MGRELHVILARLNRAIADYSLARLEFTLLQQSAAPPPVLTRVGGRPSSEEAPQRNWADVMKRIATLQSYLDAARAANSALDHDNSFARLARTANEVAVLAWSMESMHRRHGRGRTH